MTKILETVCLNWIIGITEQYLEQIDFVQRNEWCLNE